MEWEQTFSTRFLVKYSGLVMTISRHWLVQSTFSLTQIQNRPNTKLVAPFQQIMYYKIKQGDAQTAQSMLDKIKTDQTKLNKQ